MNDVDITGPLPVVHADEQPAGWIPEGRHAEPGPAAEPESAPATGGADPDLPWDFATEPSAANPTEVTSSLPILSRAEPGPDLAGSDAHGVADGGSGSVTADGLAVVAPPPLPLETPGDEIGGPVVPPTEESLAETTAGGGGPIVPSPSRSRHGQPAPLSRAWNAGVAGAIAVAAVVVGIIAFQHSSGSPSNAGAGPAFVLPTSAPATNPNLASPPPGLDALPKASTGASGAASATAAAAANGVPANAPNVTVLNETTTKGLAASEAEKVRAAGWTVRRVTNINARLTQTTVYYDASQEAAAKALVASVPSVKAALPRPSYVLSTGGLIVVVASDAA